MRMFVIALVLLGAAVGCGKDTKSTNPPLPPSTEVQKGKKGAMVVDSIEPPPSNTPKK